MTEANPIRRVPGEFKQYFDPTITKSWVYSAVPENGKLVVVSMLNRLAWAAVQTMMDLGLATESTCQVVWMETHVNPDEKGFDTVFLMKMGHARPLSDFPREQIHNEIDISVQAAQVATETMGIVEAHVGVNPEHLPVCFPTVKRMALMHYLAQAMYQMNVERAPYPLSIPPASKMH